MMAAPHEQEATDSRHRHRHSMFKVERRNEPTSNRTKSGQRGLMETLPSLATSWQAPVATPPGIPQSSPRQRRQRSIPPVTTMTAAAFGVIVLLLLLEQIPPAVARSRGLFQSRRGRRKFRNLQGMGMTTKGTTSEPSIFDPFIITTAPTVAVGRQGERDDDDDDDNDDDDDDKDKKGKNSKKDKGKKGKEQDDDDEYDDNIQDDDDKQDDDEEDDQDDDDEEEEDSETAPPSIRPTPLPTTRRPTSRPRTTRPTYPPTTTTNRPTPRPITGRPTPLPPTTLAPLATAPPTEAPFSLPPTLAPTIADAAGVTTLPPTTERPSPFIDAIVYTDDDAPTIVQSPSPTVMPTTQKATIDMINMSTNAPTDDATARTGPDTTMTTSESPTFSAPEFENDDDDGIVAGITTGSTSRSAVMWSLTVPAVAAAMLTCWQLLVLS